jgi:phosphomannomutase
MSSPDSVVEAARAWQAEDPDPETREELQVLIEAGDVEALAERFGARLAFGTAGLRAPLGAGPTRMNRLVVRQTAAGLCRYLGDAPRVVVGYDARHKSDAFAEDTARVVAAAGGRAWVLPRPLPTPVLAYAVRHLDVDAGVMVTASHNPPADNGYKVYLGDGAQLVPPADQEIAACIADAAAVPVPLAEVDDEAVVRLDDEVVDAYREAVLSLTLVPTARDAVTVYTAMHGVGRDVVVDVLGAAGFPPPVQVAEQVEPDPDFPTVAFPNPEEPGALDLSLAAASKVDADVVLANDPDADRLGVAVPGPSGWDALTGNEIGALLADHVLRHTSGADRLVVTTVVSSRLLGRMAEAHGVVYAETLTGFKWIARASLDRPDLRLVFGYEEALGYLVGDVVLDKDGVSAALIFAELVAELKAQGRTVRDRLDDLASEYGLHATDQLSLRLDGPDGTVRIAAIMERLRADPPAALGGRGVERVDDLLDGTELLPTDAVILALADDARVVVRPSGTEPKLKAYLEVVLPGPDRVAADHALDLMRDDLASWFET